MRGVEHKGEEALTVANPHFEPWRSSGRSVDNMPVESVSLKRPPSTVFGLRNRERFCLLCPKVDSTSAASLPVHCRAT